MGIFGIYQTGHTIEYKKGEHPNYLLLHQAKNSYYYDLIKIIKLYLVFLRE